MTFSIVVLSSSGGSIFQNIINNQNVIGYSVDLLVVDRNCKAIERAENCGIKWRRIEKKNCDDFSEEVNNIIPSKTDLVVLSGFLSILGRQFCEKWENKIINVHPSLLPKFGGKGMYGVKVHEAVMKAREEYTGCTVHYVSAEIDAGKILVQRSIKVDYQKTPWELGGEVHQLEKKVLLEAIELIMKKKL
ncbi:MAG: hypothetical protein JW795_05480 [Chitinivibrionales bacterium]|nr:hypothetical protein [Chitinivibrionales bacterium]